MKAFLRRLVSLVQRTQPPPSPKSPTSTAGGGGGSRSQSRSQSQSQSQGRTFSKQSSVSYSYLEHKLREALVAYLRARDAKDARGADGHVKIVHAFNQFWLQIPKLQDGFKVVETRLEEKTGSRDGPLRMDELLTHADYFGLSEESALLQHVCSHAQSHRCGEADFVGLVMVLLIMHLTDPPQPGLDPAVRVMLCCLESCFTHFQSARNGRLDKREVAEAMGQECAKAHAKEGKEGKTSHRLAAKLFESMEWSQDNTITFEREFAHSRGNSASGGVAMRASVQGISPVSTSNLSTSNLKGILRKGDTGGLGLPGPPAAAEAAGSA